MDSENIESAKRLKEHGIKLAGLHETFAQAKDMLMELGERGAKCPEQRKQIPLNGACVACKICLKADTNITFSITKR
jgi:hypothetical protein